MSPDPDGEPLVGLLEDALVTLFIAGEPGSGPAGQTLALVWMVVHALQRFSELSVNKQAALIRVVVAAVTAAGPGPVARGGARGQRELVGGWGRR